MGEIKSNLRVNTGSQAVVDWSKKNIFLGNNTTSKSQIKEPSATALVPVIINPGQPLFRAADETLTSTVDWSKFVGVFFANTPMTITSATAINSVYCHRGRLNGLNITLPATKTMDSIESGLAIRDYFNAIGFIVDTTTVDFTEFDN